MHEGLIGRSSFLLAGMIPLGYENTGTDVFLLQINYFQY
jgi:hypothetical protein